MRDDGTAAESQLFNTLDAARQFVKLTLPNVPVRVSKRRPEVPRKCLRIYLHLLGERR